MTITIFGARAMAVPTRAVARHWRQLLTRPNPIGGSFAQGVEDLDRLEAEFPSWFVDTLCAIAEGEQSSGIQMQFAVATSDPRAHFLAGSKRVKRASGEDRKKFRREREGDVAFHPASLPLTDEGWLYCLVASSHESCGEDREEPPARVPIAFSPVTGHALAELGPLFRAWCLRWEERMREVVAAENARAAERRQEGARADVRRELEASPPKYLAIVGFHSGRVIGVCTASVVDDVVKEEPEATFRALTQAEFHEHDEGLDDAKEAEVLARPAIRVQRRFELVSG